MTEPIQEPPTTSTPLRDAAIEIFTQAKDDYFREAAALSSKRAQLERAESMVVELRGQIAERQSLIGGLEAHMQETFAFARAEMERPA